MSSRASGYEYSRDDLKTCLRETVRLWKRPVHALDAAVCEELFLDYGFDTETILFLLQFAHQRGADTLNYLYPLAEVLKLQDVKSRTEAELTLEQNFKRYMDILVYINWNKTVPSPAEKEKIDEILLKYHPSEEEIRSAGEITRQAKRPSLQYFEAVLRNKKENSLYGRSNVIHVQEKEASAEKMKEKKVRRKKQYALLQLPEDFEQMKQTVRKEAGLSEVAYNTWIRDLQVAKSTEHRIEIRVPGNDDRFLSFVEQKYKGYFESVCRQNGVDKEILICKA